MSARQKHGALLDAELLARVYVELMGGRQIGFDLAVESETEAMDFAAPVAVHPSPRAAVKAVVSADELERHRAFVAGLKDPVWLR